MPIHRAQTAICIPDTEKERAGSWWHNTSKTKYCQLNSEAGAFANKPGPNAATTKKSPIDNTAAYSHLFCTLSAPTVKP